MATLLLLPPIADMHVHLRQGAMCAHVTRALAAAGVGTALVMPNTVPPIATAADAVRYRNELVGHAPSVNFLMTLYLTPELLRDPRGAVADAVRAGCVVGVKYYPHGVTTNSTCGMAGVHGRDPRAFVETYAPLLEAMQDAGLVLNLHGECPGVDPMDAESTFLATLEALSIAYPRLRIVLEHATTRAAVELVERLPRHVACTVTAHHLQLICDDWRGGNAHNYCKPVAKHPDDRAALWDAVRRCDRVFLGSDSAPHARAAKESRSDSSPPAGIYSGEFLLPVLATSFEAHGILNILHDFVYQRARAFYGFADVPPSINLVKANSEAGEIGTLIPNIIRIASANEDGAESLEVVPFMAGSHLPWRIELGH